jgi:hypothetical protein
MAIKNASKESPHIFSGANNPNTLKINPKKIGDIFVRTDTKQLFFAYGLTSTSWGTCGTAGG